MSDNPLEQHVVASQKKLRRKFDKTKLPTPPPDPQDKDKDFFDYLESLHKSLNPGYARSTSTFAPAIATEEAFDHLEKLYKLMEQMLELREQNARLHRRIRDLEHLNNLEKMHKELETEGVTEQSCSDLKKNTNYAETIIESILSDSKKDSSKSYKLRPSILRRQRRFSGSTTEKSEDLSSPSKVSKWTKVKAAFKWEKAAPTPQIQDNKSQDSGISGISPNNIEIARYLRVPSTSDEAGHSPADSGAAGVSTPGSLSTASSIEDLQHLEPLDFRSSEEDHNYIPNHQDDSSSGKNHSKTPWSKMKKIIHPRNSVKKKQRLSAQSDDIQIDLEPCSDHEDVFEEPSSIEIPPHILQRYRQIINEDNLTPPELRAISKWTNVKKAFLTSSKPDETQSIKEEIQQNYKELKKKLSLEFQEKSAEWEKTKQNSPRTSNPSSSCNYLNESHDPNFLRKLEEWQRIKTQPKPQTTIPMTRQCDLPPEFKKKLQEWEKIKKSSTKEPSSSSKKKIGDFPRWKSLSGHRSETSTNNTVESSTNSHSNLDVAQKRLKEKTPSPKLIRKNSSPKYDKKELHWYEKELSKIEKEKQRLERERQKFLERAERLSKLKRSIPGGNKKEVLIHMQSGCYRFEGISRKFTQKLYEWEKAQGIKPEASTFALLSSSVVPEEFQTSRTSTNQLIRSKSADSIAISALNLTCPLMSQQPSSLSLNDVDDLEKEVLGDSKSSSMQYMMQVTREEWDLDEPEALIVEVEDYEEETASPLQTFVRKELPIYQRQEGNTMCEGETITAPKVQRSESTRAQTNYNLIEEIFGILKSLCENELEIKKLTGLNSSRQGKAQEDHSNKINEYYEKQRILVKRMVVKIVLLQEANQNVASTIVKEEPSGSDNYEDLLEAIQEISVKILQMTESLGQKIETRTYNPAQDKPNFQKTFERLHEIRNKMLDLRRNLSYICAASDLTAPPHKRTSVRKKEVQKTVSNESRDSRCDTSDNSLKSTTKYIKNETKLHQSQGAVKKKIKFRQKNLQGRPTVNSEDEEDSTVEQRKSKHKKFVRTRSTSQSNPEEEVEVTSKVSLPLEESPVTVFVRTTRKLFTPIGEDGVLVSPKLEASASVSHLPPLLASPVAQRKVIRDVSPNIKMMLAKYNQKITGQEGQSNKKSGGSSGSNSPIAWRSPTTERRVKAQTQRYQEVLNKLSPLLGGRREVQKSASAGFLHNKQVTIPKRELVPEKSASSKELTKPALTLYIPPPVINTLNHSPEIRYKKIQQAKEEFLNSSSTPTKTLPPTRNRLSQISFDSESSYDSSSYAGLLTKSASAGMINIDPDAYKQINPEFHADGYVSLPRNTKKPLLGGRFGLNSITAKFRKVKMRKGKDTSKMNTVSTLCRQSLVVDINTSQESNVGKLDDSSSSSKSSWVKTKLFNRK